MKKLIFISVLSISCLFTSNLLSYAELIDNDDDTVTDTELSIMWQKEPYEPSNWQGRPYLNRNDAIWHCSRQTTGRYEDWHLPDTDLLNDLFKKHKMFPDKLEGVFWATDNLYSFENGSKMTDKWRMINDVNALCFRIMREFKHPENCSPYSDLQKLAINSKDNYVKCSPLLISAWKKYGFDADDIAKWKNVIANESMDILNIGPEEARKWITNSFDASEAMSCRSNGFYKKESDAAKWKMAGISCTDAEFFLKRGISLETASNWIKIASDTKNALALIDRGLTVDESTLWVKEGVTAQEIISWKDNGFTLDESRNWIREGISAKNVMNWKNPGFTPESAGKWQKDFTNGYIASEWKDRGFEANEAAEWSNNKFNAGYAQLWKKEGWSPLAASKWSSFTPAEARNVQKLCPKGFKSMIDLIQTNPFDTEGYCYQVFAGQFQFLSRTEGLYKCYPEQIVFIDFGKESAPTQYSGYVAGQGAYSYYTTTGAKQVIPYLKKIKLN